MSRLISVFQITFFCSFLYFAKILKANSYSRTVSSGVLGLNLLRLVSKPVSATLVEYHLFSSRWQFWHSLMVLDSGTPARSVTSTGMVWYLSMSLGSPGYPQSSQDSLPITPTSLKLKRGTPTVSWLVPSASKTKLCLSPGYFAFSDTSIALPWGFVTVI